MSITMNLYYTGKDGNARKFAEEMEQSGTAALIREEDGNERYEYFIPRCSSRFLYDEHDCGASGKIRSAYESGTVCFRR